MAQEKFIIGWDGNASPPRWQVDLLISDDDGERRLPSSAIPGFPVDIDGFGPMEEDLLIDAIKASFPEAQVNMKF